MSTRPSTTALVRRLRSRPASSRPGHARPDWYLNVIGAGVGLLTALGAIGFARALEATEAWTSGMQGRMPLWALALIPMCGALLTGVLVYAFAREAGGHGVPQVLNAIMRKGGDIPARIGVVKVAASICTVGSGGSAGAEGPIVQIGSTAGSVVARRLRLPREHVPTLVGCGAAAGISSIFNAPIAGVFFALEILLRDFSLKTFTPIVIASVFSTALTQVVLGDNNAIFAYDLEGYVFTLGELPSYIALGGVCALVAVGFTRLLHAAEDGYARLRLHPIVRPVTGAFMLGVLGMLFLVVLGRSGDEPFARAMGSEHTPAFFGNGYETIRHLIEPPTYLVETAGEHTQLAIMILLLLLVAKALATTCTIASGGSGGVFAPSLFLGATVGSTFGIVADRVGLVPAAGSPASYALVGMAAVVAGTTFAPLTAILLLFELTREPLVLAPIMLAAIVSTTVARRLMPDSIYTMRLRQSGLRLGTAQDLSLLRRIPVSRVKPAELPPEPVYASDPLSKLITLHARHHVPDFVVVDQRGRYLGMVTGADIRTALIDREAIPLLLVAELLRDDLPTIAEDETLDTVLDKFARHDVASLTLVDGDARPDGLITRSRVMSCYKRALEES